MSGIMEFLLIALSQSQILFVSESVPLPSDSNFAFANSTGIFLPSDPFPIGARQTINGVNQSIEEFRSLQIENSSTIFQFPATKQFMLSYWRIPSNLCPSPSYLVNADFQDRKSVV
jgi:hypothetical protein